MQEREDHSRQDIDYVKYWDAPEAGVDMIHVELAKNDGRIFRATIRREDYGPWVYDRQFPHYKEP